MAVGDARAFLATPPSSSWRCRRRATYGSRPTPPKAAEAAADHVHVHAGGVRRGLQAAVRRPQEREGERAAHGAPVFGPDDEFDMEEDLVVVLSP
jgi:hypothetical protein